MTPLERASRALWEANGSPMKARDAAPAMHPPEDQPDWERFIPQARAVIDAIRDPSSAMTHAAQSESHVAGNCEVDYHGIWASMIDALLEEGR